MELSNKILINEIKQGNKKVFQSLFNSYYPLLMKFAYRFLFDAEAGKDVVQEVFINLWEKRETIEITSLKSYLFVAVKNKCLLHLRKLDIVDKHQVYLIDSYLYSQGADEAFDSDLAIEVQQALDQLPPAMKRIFSLKYVHGLTMKEIAEDLAVSISTVKTQLGRARQKLQESLLNRTGFLFVL